jgi:hypothetical protein
MLPRLCGATTGMSPAAARTLNEAVRDLDNPAQSDVLRRVGLLLGARPDPVRTPQVGLTVPQRHGVHSGVICTVRPSSTTGRS